MSSFQFSYVGPRLIPFFKTVIIYYVAWLSIPSALTAAIKCLPILCLIPFVAAQGLSLRDEHKYQRRVFIGLVFSCIGDALLVWGHIHFITAMAAFGIAHLAYIRAFGFFSWKVVDCLKGIPFFGCLLLALYILYPGLKGILGPCVAVYIFLVLFMAWRAFTRIDIMENEWTWTNLFACFGATLFVISDFLIGLNKFRIPVPYERFFVMTTYYAAQVFIAMSAVNTKDMVIKLRFSKKKPLQEKVHLE